MAARQTTAGSPSRRKLLGAWYTPDALVDHVVARALEGLPADRPLAVLDPACGDGAFLAGVQRVAGGRAELVGVDIDPDAVAAARRRLPGADIVQADALGLDWGERRFDVVVGNPPFLSQMASATTRGGRSRFGGGPYADAAAEFLALSVTLARPDGGHVALVLPQSVLTSRDAGPIRDAVLACAAPRHLWWSSAAMFDAAVHTCALVLERGGAPRPVTRSCGPDFEVRTERLLGSSWGALLTDEPEPVAVAGAPVLGDIATISVDFREQYYGLVDAVSDDVDGPPLVTSGLIEPGRCLWGERPARFAKRRFAAPRVEIARLSPRLQRWAAQRLVPKVLVANQTRGIEAVIDREGAWLPSVPVITCVGGDLDEIARVLGSPAASAWVRHHAAGSGLSPTALRLSPALLASIPCVSEPRAPTG